VEAAITIDVPPIVTFPPTNKLLPSKVKFPEPVGLFDPSLNTT
jgi:hypothetical protein